MKKMELTMLGTGNALVTEYYNTCFVIGENNQYFMVDGGGDIPFFRSLNMPDSIGWICARCSSRISTSITSWGSSG